MAMITPQMVTAVLALKSSLRPVPDELRTRVQSIRVRSAQQDHHGQHGQPGGMNWRRQQASNSGQVPFSTLRNAPSSESLGGRWRQSSNSLGSNSPGGGQQSPSPFRFSNTSPQSNLGQGQGQAQQQNPTPIHKSQSSSSVGLPMTPTPQTPTMPMRYISKFHNGAKKGDDQILNTVILNKLNMFSVKTYDDVKAFLLQILGSDEREFVREFTWLVFRKAAAEDKFCPLFAKLLSEIQRQYPVILEEMRNLHTTYLDIWDASEDSPTKVDRRCRLGYSQFLAELTALQVIEVESMVRTLEVLKKHIEVSLKEESRVGVVEEYIDCLKCLCGAKMTKDTRRILADVLVPPFQTWIDSPRDSVPGLSSKGRFACMDLRDSLQKA